MCDCVYLGRGRTSKTRPYLTSLRWKNSHVVKQVKWGGMFLSSLILQSTESIRISPFKIFYLFQPCGLFGTGKICMGWSKSSGVGCFCHPSYCILLKSLIQCMVFPFMNFPSPGELFCAHNSTPYKLQNLGTLSFNKSSDTRFS